MSGTTTPAVKAKHGRTGGPEGPPSDGGPPSGRGPSRRPGPGGTPHGFFAQYKPEQGKKVRTGTFIALGLLIAWGAKFLDDQLAGFQGDEAWRLLITPGIPILFAVVMGALAWRVSFVMRKPSDFMIATEGEMHKVSWSTKAEIIGSTKVVILFTVMLAILLFVVDLVFKELFGLIGVLKIKP